jgi:hypothetical protein
MFGWRSAGDHSGGMDMSRTEPSEEEITDAIAAYILENEDRRIVAELLGQQAPPLAPIPEWLKPYFPGT